MKNYFQEPIVRAALVLACGPIIAALIGGYAFYQARAAGDVITVTGSARETVTSDHAKLTVSVSAKSGLFDQSVGYAALERGIADVTKKLAEQGLTEVEMMPQSVYEQYSQNAYQTNAVTGYQMSQDVVVQSSDVKKIQALANDAESMQGTGGYLARIGYVEYTYTKLDEMRVKLLGNAIKDAGARADAITKESSRATGALKNASSGVVQVLAKNGVDISDYGSYDTQSIEKDVMVTVRAVFGIK
jgi:hypothetical protein